MRANGLVAIGALKTCPTERAELQGDTVGVIAAGHFPIGVYRWDTLARDGPEELFQTGTEVAEYRFYLLHAASSASADFASFAFHHSANPAVRPFMILSRNFL